MMVISRNVLMLLLQLVSLFLVKLSFAEREVITEFPEDYDAFEFVHEVIEESDVSKEWIMKFIMKCIHVRSYDFVSNN